MRAILETDCLCKAYVNRDTGKTIALSDVSLQIPHDAFYGILGESGSGKSTLAALLSGYETPDRGNIQLNGRCLCGLSRKEWRIIYQDLQLVFQNAPLSFNPRSALRGHCYRQNGNREHRQEHKLMHYIPLWKRLRSPVLCLTAIRMRSAAASASVWQLHAHWQPSQAFSFWTRQQARLMHASPSKRLTCCRHISRSTA